jgi:hypothetical protein
MHETIPSPGSGYQGTNSRGHGSSTGLERQQHSIYMNLTPGALKQQRLSVRQLLDSVQPLIPVLVSAPSNVRSQPQTAGPRPRPSSPVPSYLAGRREPESHSQTQEDQSQGLGRRAESHEQPLLLHHQSLPVPTTPHWNANTAAKFLAIAGYHLLYEDSMEDVLNYILKLAFSRVAPTAGLGVDEEAGVLGATPTKHRFGTTYPPTVPDAPLPTGEASVGDTLLSMEGITDLILGVRYWDMALQLTSDQGHLPSSLSAASPSEEEPERTSLRSLTVSQQFVGTLLFRLIASTRHSPSPADVLAHLQTLLTPALCPTPFFLMDLHSEYTDPTILQHLPDEEQQPTGAGLLPSVTQLSRFIALRRAWQRCFERVASGPAALGLELGHLLMNLLEIVEVRTNTVASRAVQVMLNDWVKSMTTPNVVEESTVTQTTPVEDQERILIVDVLAHSRFLQRLTVFSFPNTLGMEGDAGKMDSLHREPEWTLTLNAPHSAVWLASVNVTLQRVLLSMHSFPSLEALEEVWEGLLVLKAALRSWVSSHAVNEKGVLESKLEGSAAVESGNEAEQIMYSRGLRITIRLLDRCIQHCSVCTGRHLKKAVVKPSSAANGKSMKKLSTAESPLQLERILVLALLTSPASEAQPEGARSFNCADRDRNPLLLHHRCLSFLFAGLRERYGPTVFARQEIPQDCLLLDPVTGQPLDLVSGLWAPPQSNGSPTSAGDEDLHGQASRTERWVQESWRAYLGTDGERGRTGESEALRDLLQSYRTRMKEYSTKVKGGEDGVVQGGRPEGSDPQMGTLSIDDSLFNRFARSPDWVHEWQCAMTVPKKSTKPNSPK